MPATSLPGERVLDLLHAQHLLVVLHRPLQVLCRHQPYTPPNHPPSLRLQGRGTVLPTLGWDSVSSMTFTVDGRGIRTFTLSARYMNGSRLSPMITCPAHHRTQQPPSQGFKPSSGHQWLPPSSYMMPTTSQNKLRVGVHYLVHQPSRRQHTDPAVGVHHVTAGLCDAASDATQTDPGVSLPFHQEAKPWWTFHNRILPLSPILPESCSAFRTHAAAWKCVPQAPPCARRPHRCPGPESPARPDLVKKTAQRWDVSQDYKG